MRDRAHDEAMAETFREDPAYAVQLLNSILAEGDQRELLITLRQMAKALGGVRSGGRRQACCLRRPDVERGSNSMV